jgi:hypothetical protein
MMLGFISLSLLCSLITAYKYAIQDGRAIYNPLTVPNSFKDELIMCSTMEDFFELSEVAENSNTPTYNHPGNLTSIDIILDTISVAISYLQNENTADVIGLPPAETVDALLGVFEPNRIPVCNSFLILSWDS